MFSPQPSLIIAGFGGRVGVIRLSRRTCVGNYLGIRRKSRARHSRGIFELGYHHLRVIVIFEDFERRIQPVNVAVGEHPVGVVGGIAVLTVAHLSRGGSPVPQPVACAVVVLREHHIADLEQTVAVLRDGKFLPADRNGGAYLDELVRNGGFAFERSNAFTVQVQPSVSHGGVGRVVRRAALGAAVHTDIVGFEEILDCGYEIVIVALILAVRRPARARPGVEVPFLVLITCDGHPFGSVRLNPVEPDGYGNVHHDDGNKHNHEGHRRNDKRTGAPVLHRLGDDDVRNGYDEPHSRRHPDAVKRRAVEQHLHTREQFRFRHTHICEFTHIFGCGGQNDRECEERQTEAVEDNFQGAEEFDLVLAALIHNFLLFYNLHGGQGADARPPLLPVSAAQSRTFRTFTTRGRRHSSGGVSCASDCSACAAACAAFFFLFFFTSTTITTIMTTAATPPTTPPIIGP